MPKDIEPERVTVLMDPEFLKEVEVFQHAYLVRARSDAILALLRFGLGYPEEAAKYIEQRKKK